MAQRYVRAVDVLSEEQLKVVSAAVKGRGCFLWIPSARTVYLGKREACVVRLRDEGRSNGEIAARLFISPRSVRRIVARQRKQQQQPEKRRRG